MIDINNNHVILDRVERFLRIADGYTDKFWLRIARNVLERVLTADNLRDFIEAVFSEELCYRYSISDAQRQKLVEEFLLLSEQPPKESE